LQCDAVSLHHPHSVIDTMSHLSCSFFFFNDPAPTEIYTLSLHDALPIWDRVGDARSGSGGGVPAGAGRRGARRAAGTRGGLSTSDRKSTRLNSSHVKISYAVFCLKKKKKKKHIKRLYTNYYKTTNMKTTN